VKEAQSMGFLVIPWTINKQVDMTNLTRLGIDGIITDYPDVLRNVVRSQGLPMPQSAGSVN
jgi:glycerophosphoryl diester phosphodiesterase